MPSYVIFQPFCKIMEVCPPRPKSTLCSNAMFVVMKAIAATKQKELVGAWATSMNKLKLLLALEVIPTLAMGGDMGNPYEGLGSINNQDRGLSG